MKTPEELNALKEEVEALKKCEGFENVDYIVNRIRKAPPVLLLPPILDKK